jgi:hypothetical protein
VRLDRLSAPVRAAIAATLCAVLLACLAPAPAGAAPALSWSASKIDETLTAVSCASDTLCVAVDGEEHVLISTNPAAGAGASWKLVPIAGAGVLTGISCASNSLCVAVDKSGHALISTNPTAGAASTWSLVEVHGAGALTGVSCASSSLCVAVAGNGSAFVSTNPAAGASATWNKVEIDAGHALSAVSCASSSLCVAVDNAGRALTSGNPAGGSWQARTIDSNPAALELVSVSCAPTPAGVCVAVDNGGEALASGDPGAGLPGASTSTWSTTPVELGAPTGVSCAAAGLCVLVDGSGDAYIDDDPTAAEPSWTFAGIDSPTALSGVSCESEGLCAAVDETGHVLIAQVPPPVLATSAPSAVGETTATLSGTVDPEDATLTECSFEYGPSEAYGQSAPCATGGVGAPDLAGGAAQAVSAPLSGLAANTTYHYRLVASSASGEARTLDAAFKTTAPPLVQPHPSIGGIPARGQRLTCKSGVSGTGASAATLSYAWLRDTKAIAGANGSTYVVASADVSHHLQCRVTATNAGGSASATSAFVNVPAGGLGSISETQVGSPHVAGRTVSVPLTCSAQAAGSCTIALRLTVVETLRGSHVVAVAAQRTSHRTVTVGASTAHLPAGAQRTVTVALNATGRRLLARVHKLTVKLSVSGTVVGAISAQLRSATVTLGGAGKASSRRRR